ncbi:UNVERIFIED_CONTAM: hypothetical protein GTU68_062993 [Idotea baltica]|nr:hypothetical protein [Idotea baltica]
MDPDMDDSKKLSHKCRNRLRIKIKREAIAYAVSFCTPQTIDKINILNASFVAMHHAIRRLKVRPDKLLIDGNRFNVLHPFPYECIIKGDGKIGSIAAASILAKTYRDDYMKRKAKVYPQYGWVGNKGYPTVDHRKAIVEFGITPLHRRSFRLKPEPTQLDIFTD